MDTNTSLTGIMMPIFWLGGEMEYLSPPDTLPNLMMDLAEEGFTAADVIALILSQRQTFIIETIDNYTEKGLYGDMVEFYRERLKEIEPIVQKWPVVKDDEEIRAAIDEIMCGVDDEDEAVDQLVAVFTEIHERNISLSHVGDELLKWLRNGARVH